MALMNKNSNEYYRIEKIDLENEIAEIWEYKDQQHRIDGDTKWLFHKIDKVTLSGLNEYLASSEATNENVFSNIIRCSYIILKTNDRYCSFEDC